MKSSNYEIAESRLNEFENYLSLHYSIEKLLDSLKGNENYLSTESMIFYNLSLHQTLSGELAYQNQNWQKALEHFINAEAIICNYPPEAFNYSRRQINTMIIECYRQLNPSSKFIEYYLKQISHFFLTPITNR